MTPEERTEKLAPLLARIHGMWLREISIGDGWIDLVTQLDRDIAAYDPSYTIAQVKEKCGGLRYYLDSVDPQYQDEIQLLIRTAERQSYQTCEVCGKPGSERSRRGWLTTRCDDDYKDGWSSD